MPKDTESKDDNLYSLEVVDSVDKIFQKLERKNPIQAKAIDRKVQEILKYPHQFKPLRSPMQHMRRVHIGPFVLVYEIDEPRKVVTIRRYEHHDEAYR